MVDEKVKKTPAEKAISESLYQKKSALQTIYEVAIGTTYPAEEKIDQIVNLAKVSGVYIEKKY